MYIHLYLSISIHLFISLSIYASIYRYAYVYIYREVVGGEGGRREFLHVGRAAHVLHVRLLGGGFGFRVSPPLLNHPPPIKPGVCASA